MVIFFKTGGGGGGGEGGEGTIKTKELGKEKIIRFVLWCITNFHYHPGCRQQQYWDVVGPSLDYHSGEEG